jgi:TRAP-type C4-dicarboxylate transport system substrate-binding protein
MEKQILEQFKAAGVTIYQMNAEDKKTLMAAGATVSDKWKKDLDAKGLPGTEILDLFLKKLSAFQATVDAEGYPWARK